MVEIKLYHVVAVNEDTGKAVRLTEYPMPHGEALAMAARFSHHPARRIQLQDSTDQRTSLARKVTC